MAVSSTYRSVNSPAGWRLTTGTITFDSSYPAGGEAVSNTQWGNASRKPDFVILQPRATDTAGVDLMIPAWDKANGKVQVYWVDTTADDSPLDEVTDTTSLATYKVDFLAIYLEFEASTTT